MANILLPYIHMMVSWGLSSLSALILDFVDCVGLHFGLQVVTDESEKEVRCGTISGLSVSSYLARPKVARLFL